MSKDVVENYINNQKYNALQKKKRPNERWVSLAENPMTKVTGFSARHN